eukprot:jgi/Tetstr1/423674/TSEL_014308.t1
MNDGPNSQCRESVNEESRIGPVEPRRTYSYYEEAKPRSAFNIDNSRKGMSSRDEADETSSANHRASVISDNNPSSSALDHLPLPPPPLMPAPAAICHSSRRRRRH